MPQQGGFVKLDAFTIQVNFATVGNFQAGKDAEGSGFATTRGADEDEAVDVLKFQRNTRERGVAVEGFGNVGDFKFQSAGAFPASGSKARWAASKPSTPPPAEYSIRACYR